MDKGIVYNVDDPEKPGRGRPPFPFIREVKMSVESLRRYHDPCPPITIFTNHKKVNIPDVNLVHFNHEDYKKVTDQTVSYARGSKPNRIMNLIKTPYEYTIYLDSDTFATRPVLDDIFNLLKTFDIAMCHTAAISEAYGREIPSTFPEYNCGLIAYRKSKCQDLLKNWLELYSAQMSGHDQGTFRQALFHSGLRIATMPQQYNWKYLGTLPTPMNERPANKRALVKMDWWKRIPMPRIIHNSDRQKLYAEGKLEKYCE